MDDRPLPAPRPPTPARVDSELERAASYAASRSRSRPRPAGRMSKIVAPSRTVARGAPSSSPWTSRIWPSTSTKGCWSRSAPPRPTRSRAGAGRDGSRSPGANTWSTRTAQLFPARAYGTATTVRRASRRKRGRSFCTGAGCSPSRLGRRSGLPRRTDFATRAPGHRAVGGGGEAGEFGERSERGGGDGFGVDDLDLPATRCELHPGHAERLFPKPPIPGHVKPALGRFHGGSSRVREPGSRNQNGVLGTKPALLGGDPSDRSLVGALGLSR